MFLTRITLNPARSGTHKLVSNPRSMHAAVEKSFPDKGDRILWRLDTSSRDPQLFILSPQRPSVEHIIEQAGRINDTDGVVSKDYSRVLSDISEGKVYQMQSLANITKMVNKKRVPLVKTEEIEKWLERQAIINGFKIASSLLIEPKPPLVAKKETGNVVLERNLIHCKIVVTDAEKFRTFIKSGLGRGKAYGLGMILLGKQ